GRCAPETRALRARARRENARASLRCRPFAHTRDFLPQPELAAAFQIRYTFSMVLANSVSHRHSAGTTADARIAHWIARDLVSSPPRAKSLVITVWGDSIAPHGGAVWLTGLIRLL